MYSHYNQERVRNIESWLDNKIDWINKDNQNVRFEQIINAYKVGQRYEIDHDIFLDVKHISSNIYILLCTMKGVLLQHFHDNLQEHFFMLEGEMFDNCNEYILLKEGDFHTFLELVKHEPRTGTDTFSKILIIGEKTK